MIVFVEGSTPAVEALSKRQRRALDTLLNHACDKGCAGAREVEYSVDVRRTATDGAWVYIQPDVPGLPPENALRILTRLETWHAHIGPRGGLSAYTYPRTLDQFSGLRWCGILIVPTATNRKRRKRQVTPGP
jgi:hypothetical protein